MPYNWPMHDWISSWGAWHMLIPLIFWIAVIAGIAMLIRNLLAGQSRNAPEKRALEVLGERYAKGEIDREDYLRRRQDIIGA